MTQKKISHKDIQAMETRHRARLINSLSGYKSANLIGTRDEQGQENLAIVSSVVHLGSNPPLLGFIVRPRKSRRHTLENILDTHYFTINAINRDFIKQAHQTSARYAKDISEFESVGLTPYYQDNFSAPFVLESNLRIGLALKEHIIINSNQTEMLIGEIQTISLPEQAMMPDGHLDLSLLDIVSISGLDSYHTPQKIHRLSYAKPDQPISMLTTEGEATD